MPEDFPCIPFVRTRQVAFHDTDASGVAHFSRLLCLVEEVEHEYLRSRGVEVLSPDCGWPRVHVEADYSSSGNQFSGMEICCISFRASGDEGKICSRPCGEGRQTSGNSGIGEGMPDFRLFKRRGCL